MFVEERLTPTQKSWGEARTVAEALRIKMDIAREREYHLALKWISSEVSLATYQQARADFEAAAHKYEQACKLEAHAYDLLTNYQQDDAADFDSAADDDIARLQQS